MGVYFFLSPFANEIVSSMSVSLGLSHSLEALLTLGSTGILFGGCYLLFGGLLWKKFREVK